MLNNDAHNDDGDVLLLESEKKRQREAAADLAIMRERLRSMGILSKQARLSQQGSNNNSNSNADTVEIERGGHEHEQGGSDTPSTVSEEDQIEQKTTVAVVAVAAEVMKSSHHTDVSTDDALAKPIIDMNSSGQSQQGVGTQQGRQQSSSHSSSNSSNSSRRSLEIALELKQKTEKHQRILR